MPAGDEEYTESSIEKPLLATNSNANSPLERQCISDCNALVILYHDPASNNHALLLLPVRQSEHATERLCTLAMLELWPLEMS